MTLASALASESRTDTPMLEAAGVVKVFYGGDGGEVRVLEGVDISVARGEMVAIIGASGAGKSTLLHVLGALERPTAGDVRLNGERAAALDDEALAGLRNRSVGFVFQFHHLLKEFSALENVMMPMRIAGRATSDARDRAKSLLVRVGLESRMSHRPSEMSGGEQQRTAVARALAMQPPLVLADEPSGNLDHHNAEALHDLFAELAREMSLGLVVVTHNRSLAARAGRVLLLEDGRLSDNFGQRGNRLMLCDQCHERDAVLNLTQIVENAVTQLHLCEKCAAERGIETTVSMPKHPLGDFLDAVQQQALVHPSDSARCSYCGTSLKDFRASGRLGCAQCYGAFEQSLKDLLRRVHGSAQHVGRMYTVPNPELLERDVSLGALRAQLQKAIDNEEFESAARLRDQIRTLELVGAVSKR